MSRNLRYLLATSLRFVTFHDTVHILFIYLKPVGVSMYLFSVFSGYFLQVDCATNFYKLESSASLFCPKKQSELNVVNLVICTPLNSIRDRLLS